MTPPGVAVSRRAATIAVAAIVILAALLRFRGAGDQLWYDEIRTLVGSVRAPIADIVSHFPSNNDHVLYSLLAHLSIAAGGDTPLMLRLPALLAGIASVALIYACGREVTDRFEAASAALLAALSYHHVWFSQNARGYTLLLCVALATTLLLLRGLRTGGRAPFIAYGVVAALGAYTHLTMVLAVIGQALVVAAHLLRARAPLAAWVNPALGFVSAGALTLLLYLPLLGDVGAFFGDASTTPKAATAGWALAELWRGLGLSAAGGVAALVGGTVFVTGCVSYARQAPMLVGLFFVPGATVYLTSLALARPTFPRFFFFLAGFVLLVIVRGVAVITTFGAARLGPRIAAHAPALHGVAVAAMVAVLLIQLPRVYAHPKQDYAGALALVEARAEPGDIIAFGENGVDYPYRHYYGRDWPRLADAANLETLRHGHRVWVLRTFDRYLKLRDASLLDSIRSRCTEAAKFPGTLADGDIRVSRCAALPGTGAPR